MTVHHVLWHCAELASSEHAVLRWDGEWMHLAGRLALALDDEPCDIDHEVDIDAAAATTALRATITTATGARRLELWGVAGRWTRDGAPAPTLAGCDAIDLGWSPATNTTPLRRWSDLSVGASAELLVAWVRFPELDVLATPQRYSRIATDRWRFTSGPFDFTLVVDADGIVQRYGDDLWVAVASSAT